MHPTVAAPCALVLAALAVTPFAARGSVHEPAPAGAQEAQTTLQRAFWLAEHEGDTAGAQALYARLAADAGADPAARAEARERAATLAEDLAADDLARLLPAGAVLYAELSAPGEHVRGLLRALGLEAADGRRVGVSPLLVDALLGARGLAVALTRLPDGDAPPAGVAVLHPGELDVTRGLVETLVPAGGRPGETIEGHPTWSVPVERGLELTVALTRRLVVVGSDRYEVGAVLERLHGVAGDALADDAVLARALAPRRDALLSVCVDARQLLPFLRGQLELAARHDPEARLVAELADYESLRTVALHLSAGEDGLALRAALELGEDHESVLFDLLRRPSVGADTLAAVPSGAAFALAAALNPEADVAPLQARASGRPVVAAMDLGRELFANVVDVALFGLPPEPGRRGLPDVALVVRSNDVTRTSALLELGLGLAARAEGGAAPVAETVAGVEARRYVLGGVPVLAAVADGRVVVTPSRAALARALDAAQGRETLLDDAALEHGLARLDGAGALIAWVAPGRLARLAAQLADPGVGPRLEQLAELLAPATVAAALVQDDARLGLELEVRGLPDVSALVERALRGEDPLGAPTTPARAARPEAQLGAAAPGAPRASQPFGPPRGPSGPAPAAPRLAPWTAALTR